MELSISIIIELFLRVAIFLGFFILFLIMLWQKRRVATHSLPMQLVAALGVIAMSIYVIDFITYTAWQNDQLRIYLHLTLFTTVSIMYYLWYRHYEAFISIKPPPHRHHPIFYLLSVESGIAILEFIGLVRETYMMSIISHLTYIIGILAFFVAWKVLRETHRLMKEKSTFFEFVAINAILAGNLVFVTEDILVTAQVIPGIPQIIKEFPTYFLFLLGNLIIVLSLLVLIGNYILHPEYLFRIPTPIHSVLIYNQHGILAYHRNVKTPLTPVHHLRAELFSAILSSIKSVFDQMIGADLEVTSIVAQRYRIILQSLPDESGTVVLISSGESLLLFNSLRRFINLLDDDMIKSLKKEYIKPQEITTRLDPVVMKAFPYLTFID